MTDIIEKEYWNRCATPSDINLHLKTLRRYAEQCEHVTELGVRTIVSTWAFLAAKPKTLISVDMIHPKHAGGDLDKVILAAKEVGVDFTFVQGDDREIDLPETDLLFIDTWHVYDQLKVELSLHGNKSRKFIIMHDTVTFGERGESGQQPGLKLAVEEFLAANSHWRMREHSLECNGLMVLERSV